MSRDELIITLFGIFSFIALIILFFVNVITLKKEDVDLLFKNAAKYIKDRGELFERTYNYVETKLPDEVKFVNELMEQQKIIESLDINKPSPQTFKILKKSYKMDNKFMKLIEIHPILKNDNIYDFIKVEFETNKQRIEYAIETYDKEAEKFNEFKQKKVFKQFAKLLRVKDYEYYQK